MDLAQKIIKEGLDELFQSRHFSICAIDRLAKVLGVNAESHPHYKLLHILHCRAYNEMDPEVRQSLPTLVMECLKPGFEMDSQAMAMMLTMERSNFATYEDAYVDEVRQVRGPASKVSNLLPWNKK